MKLSLEAVISRISNEFDRDPAATEEQILQLQRKFSIPSDYCEWLRWASGGEGAFGTVYFSFWPADELEKLNDEFQIQRFLGPKTFCFASNGGGGAYVFRSLGEDASVWFIPLGDLDWASARLVGLSFLDALNNALTGAFSEGS